MTLTLSEIRKIADLAHIKMEDSEYEKLAKEINKILEMISQMQSVDTSKVTPVSHPTGGTQRLREDEVSVTDCTSLVMPNAPLEEKNLFLVPKVIE